LKDQIISAKQVIGNNRGLRTSDHARGARLKE